MGSATSSSLRSSARALGDPDRRHSPSRLPDVHAFVAPLKRLSAQRRATPLLYLELGGLEKTGTRAVKSTHAACKRLIATAIRHCPGAALRSLDIVAAGPGAQWFAVLLVGRSVAAGRRAELNDADLGLVAARLRARVQQSLADAERTGILPVRLVARIGWTVVEPVHADRALQDLRQAIRGAAVLARVEDRRAMILASVTHELRTPLTSIIGYAEMLSNKSKTNQIKGRNFAAIIADEARRLNRLVDGLIDIGAWSNGKLKLRLQPLHLRAIALAARRALRPIAAGKRVRCRISGDARILADKERLHQVFINVLDNAIRYAPTSGAVDVKIRNARGDCKVIFCDSGTGFAESTKRSIGAPFAVGASGHTGLGLAIVRLLVEAHGGKISADNLKSGGGKIQIDLPADRRERADGQKPRRAGPNRRL